MGQEEKGCSGNGGTVERKSEKDVCVSSTAEAKQSLIWAMGQHMTYPCLCVSATVFLHKKVQRVRRDFILLEMRLEKGP